LTADEPIIETSSAEETESLAGRLTADLEAGDVLMFEGDVGTGKSTLIRAVMRQLGVTGAIPSPTFMIGRSYEGKVPVSHLDLHRIGSIGDEDPGLLNEYFGENRIVFVEWPGGSENNLAGMAKRVRTVSLAHLGGDSRRIGIGPIRQLS